MRRAVLFLAIFAAGGSCGWAVSPGTFYADGDRTKNAVALTFDDGPGPNTKAVLEILERYKVKGTFFMNGDQVEMRPALAKEVLSGGHEVGDHTYSHMNFYAFEKKQGADQAKEKIKDEMWKSKEKIEKATGFSPVICRMPHGYHRPWMPALAKEFNYALVNWTFGEDWLAIDAARMEADYLKKVKPGAILLFHDGGKSRQKTLEILPKIIEAAQKKNLSLVTVSEILPK